MALRLIEFICPSKLVDRAGLKALTALSHITKGRNWQDWKIVSEYLEMGRQWAMEMSNSNAPQGVRYNQAWNVWLVRNPRFQKDITKQERNDLMRCMENLPAVEAFLAGRGGAARKLNHPTSILRAWRRDQDDKEREAALERAEQASAESVKADDGTPLNIPIFPAPSFQSQNDLDDMRRAMALRKELGDDRLRRLYFAIGRLLDLAFGS